MAIFFLETGSMIRSSLRQGSKVELAEVNCQLMLMTRSGSRIFCALTIEVEAGQIRTFRVVAHLEELMHVSQN